MYHVQSRLPSREKEKTVGTSSSSIGPGSGIPLVPPWVPPIPLPQDNESDSDDEGEKQPKPDSGQESATKPPILAPSARYGSTRRNLGQFAQNGERVYLRRSLGHYIRRGMGGAATATRRMGYTVQAAGDLYGALSPRGDDDSTAGSDVLSSPIEMEQSADDVTEALVDAVRPIDGTQDSESGRVAIRNALAEMLTRFPGADLLNLSAEQRDFAVERFVALDVFNRFRLDVGKAIQDKAPSATEALARLGDIRDYIAESVSSQFREFRSGGGQMNRSLIPEFVSRALRQTFEVFEEYVS